MIEIPTSMMTEKHRQRINTTTLENSSTQHIQNMNENIKMNLTKFQNHSNIFRRIPNTNSKDVILIIHLINQCKSIIRESKNRSVNMTINYINESENKSMIKLSWQARQNTIRQNNSPPPNLNDSSSEFYHYNSIPDCLQIQSVRPS